VRLLKIIPTRELAALGPGQKIVFSTQANSVQEQMPDGAQEVLDQFVDDQNLFAEEFNKVHPKPIDSVLAKRLAKRVSKLSDPPAKLLLVFRGSGFSEGAPS